MKFAFAAVLTAVCLTLAGCEGERWRLPEINLGDTFSFLNRDPVPEALKPLPASYLGVLPCADCQGIRYHLNLYDDRTYELRREYVGRGDDAMVDGLGRWVISSDGEVLVLEGERAGEGGGERENGAIYFTILGDKHLRLRDRAGQEIGGGLNYAVQRELGLYPIEPRLALAGRYSYMADAGLFTECRTGRRWPVAQEADNASLERAYLAARDEPGAEVLARVDGLIAPRPAMEEGAPPEVALVVERFHEALPGEDCPAPFAARELLGTEWRLVRLGDEAVTTEEEREVPYLLLEENTGRAIGSAGCNRFSGAYDVEEDALAFGPIATTKMACAGEAMSRESAYLDALGRTADWAVMGAALDLYDAGGALLARFRAAEAR